MKKIYLLLSVLFMSFSSYGFEKSTNNKFTKTNETTENINDSKLENQMQIFNIVKDSNKKSLRSVNHNVSLQGDEFIMENEVLINIFDELIKNFNLETESVDETVDLKKDEDTNIEFNNNEESFLNKRFYSNVPAPLKKVLERTHISKVSSVLAAWDAYMMINNIVDFYNKYGHGVNNNFSFGIFYGNIILSGLLLKILYEVYIFAAKFFSYVLNAIFPGLGLIVSVLLTLVRNLIRGNDRYIRNGIQVKLGLKCGWIYCNNVTSLKYL